jgi:membrane-associated phospholipid phosphatase
MRARAASSRSNAAVSTLERFWLAYCACACAAALLAEALSDGAAAAPGYQPFAFVALHVVVASLQLVPVALDRRGRSSTARVARAAISVACLPIVFSALCMALPHAHPEPWEIRWLAVDHWAFGADATSPLRLASNEPSLALLQLVYASFYAIPIGACLVVLRQRGSVAFDRAVTTITGGFLLSYLGYLWFPTLGPKDVVPLSVPPGGEWLASLHVLLHEAEANHWDCFPSGHTMMSLCAALVAKREGCVRIGWLHLLAWTVVASTLVLRYHWPIDVLVGAVLAPLWILVCDALLDRDGAALRSPRPS